MKIEIKRDEFSSASIIGKLSIDGEFLCYTLENAEIGSESGKDLAIPYGEYKLKRHHPSRFTDKIRKITKNPDEKMLCVYNDEVPAERCILIHVGNTAQDTEGCILLGYTKDKDFIGSSSLAVADFYNKLKDADLDEISLIITKNDGEADDNAK